MDVALGDLARAFHVPIGILAGDTSVESGSQKARPLTLAATHRVFLPARRFLPSFLSSSMSRPLSPLLVTLARESSSSSGRSVRLGESAS